MNDSSQNDNGWKVAYLGDAIERIEAGVSPKALPRPAGPGEIGVLKVSSVTWHVFRPEENKALPISFDPTGFPTVRRGDLLLSRANTAELLASPVLAAADYPHLILSDKTLRLVPKAHFVDPRFLLYALRQPQARRYFMSHATGTSGSMRNVSQATIQRCPIPLPPLPEQKRIADILDKADAIRRKRQEAAREVSALRRSLFLELFGNPASNERQWPERELGTILEGGMRNGVSPSRQGPHRGRVLILSAITGRAFNETAIKEGTFATTFGASQLVNSVDFLICRGNGNLDLVGRGRFATSSMEGVVFPDTMIAAQVDHSVIAPEFLEEVWGTRHVRGQIEAGARTTNGTYKVNQTLLASIRIPLPPKPLQDRFAKSLKTIQRTFDRMTSGVADDLFNSLVQRAFKGAL